jgi:16S rRNA (cytosine967-C5)-methyltransferase
MKKETPRDLALKALDRLSRRPAFLSNILDHLYQASRDLDERDRAFVSQLVQGVERWRLRLDWIIGQAASLPITKIDRPVLDMLRLAVYQIFFLDRVPDSAAVNEAVKQAKKRYPRHVVSFVNGVLRNICRQKDQISFLDRSKDPVRHLSLFYSYPEWLVRMWVEELGEENAEALLAAGNRTPPLIVRANILRISRADLVKRLEQEELDAKATRYSPVGVVIGGWRGKVDRLKPFKEGLFQVQDEAAQLTSILLAPRPQSAVLDVCAGFGGKASHLAELMGNRGSVVALDTNTERLISLTENSKRLAISIIHPVIADARGNVQALLRSAFDYVMVDAPCSGLGVLSRHPDGKWNRNRKDIGRLSGTQFSILNQAAKTLRKGGRMLYVTCTISRRENEKVVETFLKENGDMSFLSLRDQVPPWAVDLVDENGFFRAFPHVHQTDGFFAALFTK